jgi:hypothetical protein
MLRLPIHVKLRPDIEVDFSLAGQADQHLS